MTARLVYVDGGCSGNGQTDLSKRRMVMVVTDDAGSVLSERFEDGGSNNIAELWAVRDALEVAREVGWTDLTIKTDSRNNQSWANPKTRLGKQLNDRARVEALRAEIAMLRQSVRAALIWVPRAHNLAGHYIERRLGL